MTTADTTVAENGTAQEPPGLPDPSQNRTVLLARLAEELMAREQMQTIAEDLARDNGRLRARVAELEAELADLPKPRV